MRRADLLSIVEASYAVEKSEGDWLSGLSHAVYAHSGLRTLGAYAQTYRLTSAGLSFGDIRFASDRTARLRALHEELGAYYMTQPNRIRATYGETDEGLALSLPGERATIKDMLSAYGVGNMYGINARSFLGEGCLLCVYLPPRHRVLSPVAREAFARIARHVATAMRLRGRLASHAASAPEAMVDANCVVQHATGDAKKKDAREALRVAAKTLLRTRGVKRGREPERDVAAWKALVAARWSLVDHFEREGNFYLVAHRNDPICAPIALLSERERQVVALATLGLANKMIAYELGIATSTVGVLIGRAMARLGMRSRRELVATYLATSRA